MESPGEDRCRHVSFRESLDLLDRYEPRKTIPKDGGSGKEAQTCQATNDIGSDPQQGCRLPIVEETVGWRRNFGRRAVLSEIFRLEEVTSDPSKPPRASRRHKATINDGPDNSGKPCAMAEIILNRMAQRNELAWLRVGLHRH